MVKLLSCAAGNKINATDRIDFDGVLLDSGPTLKVCGGRPKVAVRLMLGPRRPGLNLR